VIKIIKSYKVKLEPNNKQLTLLNSFAGTARWAYNWTLGRQQDNYKNGGKFLSDGDLRKKLTQLKQTPEFNWLYKVSNNVTKQAIKDACDAYKSFFRKKSGFPKFKSKKKSKPAFYHDNVKLKITKTHIQLERIGKIKLSEYGRIPIGKYSNPRITFDGLNWYISLGVEYEQEQQKLNGIIGIDVGIKETAILSNGIVIPNINKITKMKKLEKRKKKLQGIIAKKYQINKKGESHVKTVNIAKLEKKVKKLSKKIVNIRTDFMHKATTSIVKIKPSKIVMEDLNIKGMLKNHKLAKEIQDQSLSEFKRQLKYKCDWNGIEMVEASRWFPSSKTCSECGFIKPKLSLSERTFVCECCGFEIDRDLNAAINLKNYKVA
jgi:putative transposase